MDSVTGWFNLAHAVRITRISGEPDRGGDQRYEAILSRGRERPKFSAAEERLERLLAMPSTIIPAAPGMFAVVIRVYAADNQRPTVDHMIVERRPIVAWRIWDHGLYDATTPIVPGLGLPRAEGGPPLLIELPNGELLADGPFAATGDGGYSDLEKAKTGILEDAQAEWDDRHNHRATGL